METANSLFVGQLPKIASRYSVRRSSSSSLDPDKQSPAEPSPATKWLPGERDKYRPYVPAGYVDFEPNEPTELELDFRHSHWRAARKKVYEAMQRVQVPGRRLNRFRCCGGGAWIYMSPDGSKAEVTADHCGDRLCSACGAGRAGKIAAVLAEACVEREIRFATFTLKHKAMPLCDIVSRIYQCFLNLRNQKRFKSKVRGGAAFCEVKVGNDGMWHVHLHCVIEGEWYEAKELASDWLVATGDSHIVDIRAVTDRRKMAGYIAKYATKPMDSTVVNDPEKLDEAIVALRGRRLCLTFGSWRGIKLNPKREPTVGWKLIGRLEHWLMLAKMGRADAVKIIKALTKDKNEARKNPGDDSG